MTINHRPYQNIPTQHKPPEWGNIIALILIILFFTYMASMWTCSIREVKDAEIPRTLSPIEKAEHDRLRRYHGLDGVSVVLVKDEGLFFVRDGKEVRFR